MLFKDHIYPTDPSRSDPNWVKITLEKTHFFKKFLHYPPTTKDPYTFFRRPTIIPSFYVVVKDAPQVQWYIPQYAWKSLTFTRNFEYIFSIERKEKAELPLITFTRNQDVQSCYGSSPVKSLHNSPQPHSRRNSPQSRRRPPPRENNQPEKPPSPEPPLLNEVCN